MAFHTRRGVPPAALALLAAVSSAPVETRAQGTANTANVSIQVQPQHNAGSEAPTKRFFTVCVGTPDDLDKYGRQLTRSDGVANSFVNLPVGINAVITVEKGQYKTWQTTRKLTAGWTNHMQAGIQLGSGGPSCGPWSTPLPPEPPPPPTAPPVSVSGTPIYVADTPQITEFKLNDNAVTLAPGQYPILQFKFTGPATEVRISEMADNFPDPAAGWKPFTPQRLPNGVYTLALPTATRMFATGNSRETVYLQLRSGTKTSAIKSASINVRATYRVSAAIFYLVAKDKFAFKVSGVNVPLPEQQCSMAATGDTVTFRAPVLATALAGECIYDLFTGDSLNPGWAFVSFSFNSSSGCSSTIRRTSPANADSIAAQVRVPVVKSLGTAVSGCSGSLVSVMVEGPAGNVWQNTFRR